MRVTMTIDSVHDDELHAVLSAHRKAMQSSRSPVSIEATDSAKFNCGAVVCNMGSGYNVRTIAMTPEQAAVFTEHLPHKPATDEAGIEWWKLTYLVAMPPGSTAEEAIAAKADEPDEAVLHNA